MMKYLISEYTEPPKPPKTSNWFYFWGVVAGLCVAIVVG